MERRARRSAAGWLAVALVLAAAALSPVPASAETENCYDVWPESTEHWGTWIDAGTGAEATSIPCELYEPASTELTGEFGVTIRIYLPGTAQDGTPGWSERPHPNAPANVGQLFAEAIQKTLSELRPHLPPMSIYVVLLQNIGGQGEGPDDWDWDTQAATGFSNRCPITVFLSGLIEIGPNGNSPKNAQDVKSTIAHEIFHCFQRKYFSPQMVVDRSVNGWWVEGTAEFVASQLYPCSPTSAGFASDYRMATRLNRQDGGGYTDFIFYTHLADRYGFDFAALAEFASGMATESGPDAQDRALAAYPEIGTKFHTFAQAYVDGDISHCVEGHVPFDNIANFDAADGLEISLDAEPFTFGASIVTVPKRATYQVRLEDGSGDGPRRKTSYRAADAHGAAAWTPVSGEITLTGGCEDEARYVFISTVDGVDDAVHNASLVFSGEEEQPELPPAAVLCGAGMDPSNRNECLFCERAQRLHGSGDDKCLVGTWKLEYGYWEHEADVMREVSKGAAQPVVEADGDRILTIEADGTFRTVAGTMTTTIAQGDGHMTETAGIQPGVGNWTARDGTLQTCTIRGKEAVVRTIVTPETSMTMPPKSTRKPEHVQGATLTYNCTPGELTIQVAGDFPLEVMRPRWVYRRIASPPPDRCGG